MMDWNKEPDPMADIKAVQEEMQSSTGLEIPEQWFVWTFWTPIAKNRPRHNQRVFTYEPTAPADRKINIHRYVEDELAIWIGKKNWLVGELVITHWAPMFEGPK
jgi:hypothetical protein